MENVIALNKADRLPDLPTSDRLYVIWGFIILLVAFGGFGLWAAMIPLEGASIAPGKISVESNRKTVQHLEGGIISKILVKDGDKVKAGDSVIVLDDIQSSSELTIIKTKFYLALAQKARLYAEQQKAGAIVFSNDLTSLSDRQDIKEMMNSQVNLFNARKKSLDSEIQVQEQRIIQLKEQIQGLESVVTNQNALLASYKEEIEEWKKLYEKQMVDKLRLRDAQRKLEELTGNLSSNLSNISKLKEQIAETQEQILLRKRKFLEEVITETKEADAVIFDSMARISFLEDRLKRTVISAPVSGEVLGLKVHNTGAVIRPGDPLMEIVPENELLIVEAYVSPADIDQVHAGMEADIRFSAFNSRTTNIVVGKVISISADAFSDQRTGQSHYLAKVQVLEDGKKYLQENNLVLQPGMPAEVHILTGKRTFLSYLAKPFTDRLNRTFKEE